MEKEEANYEEVAEQAFLEYQAELRKDKAEGNTMEKWEDGVDNFIPEAIPGKHLYRVDLIAFIEKVRQEAIMETEAECQKSLKQMNDSWNDVLRDKIMEVIDEIKEGFITTQTYSILERSVNISLASAQREAERVWGAYEYQLKSKFL